MWKLRRGDVLVRPAVYDDIDVLHERVRMSDVTEVWAATHLTVREALIYSWEGSTICQTVMFKGMPVGMFGAAPVQNMAATAGVWFMATDDIKMMALPFLRLSKRCVNKMLNDYPMLFNWVHHENLASIEWLKFLGAHIEPARPFGPDMALFHFFSIKRTNLNGGVH